jgi:hypothetical protein
LIELALEKFHIQQCHLASTLDDDGSKNDTYGMTLTIHGKGKKKKKRQ